MNLFFQKYKLPVNVIIYCLYILGIVIGIFDQFDAVNATIIVVVAIVNFVVNVWLRNKIHDQQLSLQLEAFDVLHENNLTKKMSV